MGDAPPEGAAAVVVAKKRPKPTERELRRKAEIAELLRERDAKVRRQELVREASRLRTLMLACRWRHNDYGSQPCGIDGCPACRLWLKDDCTINQNAGALSSEFGGDPNEGP